MIPANIQELAACRPVAHGEVLPQEIRVGQMLLAQVILRLIARVDALLVRDADEEPAPKPVKAPREPKPARPTREAFRNTAGRAIDSAEKAGRITPEAADLGRLVLTAPAPVEPPAPVARRADGTPEDLHLRYRDAYLEGREARRGGQALDLNPYVGDRGIAGGRRLAFIRGWQEGGAA